MNPLSMFLIIFFLVFPVTIQAQHWEDDSAVGIAVEEHSRAPLVNTAALGLGHAGGLGWSTYWRNDNTQDHSFHVATKWFSYTHRRYDDLADHELALSSPSLLGFSLGTSWRWKEFTKGSVNIHTLYRPFHWLSLGIKGQSLNASPWMDYGVGLRPLMFSEDWRTRLTLFYDGRVTNAGSYENLAAGLKLNPLNGIELYGHWNFQRKSFEAGVNVSLDFVSVGGSMGLSGGKAEGGIQAFLSTKRMQSVTAPRKILLVYDQAMEITETPPPSTGIYSFFKDTGTRSLHDFLMDMKTIANRNDVKALLFNGQTFHGSFSNLLEIEQALLEVKESGKKIYFYNDSMNTSVYALAAATANAIFLNPQGILDLSGFAITKLYLKDFLERFGVRIHNFRSHDYKTAFDNFSESGMSDAEREALEYVYKALQEELERMILQGRKGRLKSTLDELFDQGLWMSAQKASSEGLIDGIMHHDQFDDWLNEQPYRPLQHSRSQRVRGHEWEHSIRPGIAIIYAKGPITMGYGVANKSVGAESLGAALREARNNPLIRGIILRVDSGGGSALASDIIAREVLLCRESGKPIVVSMGGTAASGGYTIAAPGTHVFSTAATITGSIGVIAIIPEIAELLEQFNVKADSVKTSEYADTPNFLRSMTEEEERRFHELILEYYDVFITAVAEARGMDKEEVHQVAQGRIWTGKQALDRNLVDEIGGLRDAVDLLGVMLNHKNPRIIEINPGGNSFPKLSELLGLKTPHPWQPLSEDLWRLLSHGDLGLYEEDRILYLMTYTTEEMGLEKTNRLRNIPP